MDSNDLEATYNTVRPKILFIDAYDSFSNNIIDLLETELCISVTVIKIDSVIDDFPAFVQSFSAVIAGPGPGHPANSTDVGLIGELWKLAEDNLLPVLGICLGFQSLVHAFGGNVQPLAEPRHGILRNVRSSGDSIFRGCRTIQSIQYHSLHARLEHLTRYREDVQGRDWKPWQPSNAVPVLVPLAWEFADDNDYPSRGNPQAVLMAVAHVTKPFYGIQFHPESICSAINARMIIRNWWHEVLVWRKRNYQNLRIQKVEQPIRSNSGKMDCDEVNAGFVDRSQHGNFVTGKLRRFKDSERTGQTLPTPPITPREARPVSSMVIEADVITVPAICHSLGLTEQEIVILDSEMHQRADVGEYSIIGIVGSDSVKLEYSVQADHVVQKAGETSLIVDLAPFGKSIFDYLKAFMVEHAASGGSPHIPFWGGLMGYVTYEACLETIDILPETNYNSSRRPDLSFVFVERSVVISHKQNTITIQSIKESDSTWVHSVSDTLQSAIISVPMPITPSFDSSISYRSKTTYMSAIRRCQDEIREGNAYELCLTNKACIRTNPVHLSSWQMYLRLRKLNAAPFSAYLRLGPLTLLSSSPERFLQWSRPHSTSFKQDCRVIHCQFRPIKGTVKKSRAVLGQPDVTSAEAIAILSTTKERAENLMIVDLIRHDLHGVVGSGKVTVPKLMVVEEYETVFQLVTVIEGELLFGSRKNCTEIYCSRQIYDDQDKKCYSLTQGINKRSHVLLSKNQEFDASITTQDSQFEESRNSGIDILAASLPPGSMTGAPKRRACHILNSIERKSRGIYSGVVGYLDAGGGGDFSVVIRSTVKWDNPDNELNATFPGGHKDEAEDTTSLSNVSSTDGAACAEDGYEWTIGAGGAVTSLSTEEGEWDEMTTKLKSTLRLFESERNELSVS